MKGIIFDTRQVKATLDGIMTVTRRPVKDQSLFPEWAKYASKHGNPGLPDRWCLGEKKGWIGSAVDIKFPFGQIGDRLYVKETWSEYRGFAENTIRDAPILYKADLDNCGQCPCVLEGERIFVNIRNNWKPSIHMLKKHARIFLEITDIRVERVHDISMEQAEKEGMSHDVDRRGNTYFIGNFIKVWDSRYPGSWDRKEWVWVIEFKRIEG